MIPKFTLLHASSSIVEWEQIFYSLKNFLKMTVIQTGSVIWTRVLVIESYHNFCSRKSWIHLLFVYFPPSNHGNITRTIHVETFKERQLQYNLFLKILIFQINSGHSRFISRLPLQIVRVIFFLVNRGKSIMKLK